MNRILVITPAYNEAESIEDVISAVKKELPGADILVINDGSADATSQIAKGLGVMVADLPYNMGIGAAMQAGYRYAAMHGYDIAVQVDADGQHPPDQINNLIAPVMEQKADMVIGSRFLGEGEYYPSFARHLGIKVFAFVLSFMTGRRLTDTTSGFRAANKDVIRFFADNYPEDYPEVEAIVLLRKAGFNIIETPVRMEASARRRFSTLPPSWQLKTRRTGLTTLLLMLKKVKR